MMKAQVAIAAGSESRMLLKTTGGFGVQQEVQQRPLTAAS